MTTRCRTAQPTMIQMAHTRATLAALATLLLALTTMPAQAANNYHFPDRLPPGCTDQSNGNYRCGTLTLDAGDSITVNNKATVTVGGAMTIGANTSINATGSASNLKFITHNFSLGADTLMNGSVTSILGAGLIGDRSKIVGNITTKEGVLTTLSLVEITGDIITTGITTGTVNLGANNIIHGNIRTFAGVVNLGANNKVEGEVRTAAGAVNAGANSIFAGNITTLAGVVTLGADNKVGGSINTAAGEVNLGANTVIFSDITTLAGVVALGAYNYVGGSIKTAEGAVKVGDNSRICGSIDTWIGGVVTLTANVKVGGGIHTVGAGAITISAGSTVGGSMSAAVGVITMTSVKVGGDIKALIGVITLTDTHVRGNVVTSLFPWLFPFKAPSGSSINDSSVSFPAACSATSVTPTTTAAASFDALETGTNLPWDKAARKPLYTKLIGTPFTLDIAALDNEGTLESTYVASGTAAKHVKLELFDDVGAACDAYTAPVASQTTSFTSTSFSGAAGRALSGAFTVPDVHKSLLVRIRECADSSCTSFTSTLPACSSDRFSVRPPALTLSTTTSMGMAPQPADDKTIRAGTDFTLLATTGPVGNYRGVLILDASRLTAQLPSEGALTQSGGIIGRLTPSTLTANAQAVMATYSEVGYLYIGIGAYRDDSFTMVDSVAGDCITSTGNNANLADTLVVGQYGCSIGNSAIASLGRFVPHHFSTVIAPGTAMPCPVALIAAGQTCPAAGFVYSGQPFAVTITALSASGTPTVNYRGLLARNVTLEAWSAPGMLEAKKQNPLTMLPIPVVAGHGVLGSVAAGTFALGVAGAIPVYTFPARYPAAALASPTAIYLRARENTGIAADNATSARPVAASSIEAGLTVISGRFKVDNNYGSELLAIPIMTRTQYWNGARFVDSTTDGQTSIRATDVARSHCQKNLRTGSDCVSLTLTMPASPVMVKGALRLTLSAPGKGNTGSVDVSINSGTSPWLPSTKARIGVGIYKAGPIIYLREMY